MVFPKYTNGGDKFYEKGQKFCDTEGTRNGSGENMRRKLRVQIVVKYLLKRYTVG